MGKHTPGPWSVTNGELIRVVQPKAKPVVICGVHRIGKHGGRGAGDPLANAKLLAAAPELLEQARLFEKSIRYQIALSRRNGDEEGARLQTLTLNLLREVLAKAGAA